MLEEGGAPRHLIALSQKWLCCNVSRSKEPFTKLGAGVPGGEPG